MSSLAIQELGIVVAVKTKNPSLLNEDFLRQSGIVPEQWNLSGEPSYTSQLAQLVFENGFSIAAQPDRIMFLESIGDKKLETVSAGDVAQRYVNTLKLADYRAVGINLRGYVAFESPTAANEYINNQLLSGGRWQKYGQGNARASVNILYDLENGSQLNLSISEAAIQFSERPPVPVVLFSGNFSYDLSKIAGDDKASSISSIVRDWRTNLQEYTVLIEENFVVGGIDFRVIGDAQGTLLNSADLEPENMSVSLLGEASFQKT